VIRTNNLLLDQTGVYEIPGKLVSVNLYDAAESNLGGSGITATETAGTSTEKTVRTTTKKEFDWVLLILALVLICTELYYIRSRGEL
jgi:hypothetical protein